MVKYKHGGDLLTGNIMPTLNPMDLIGCAFLKPPEEGGQWFRGIIEAIV